MKSESNEANTGYGSQWDSHWDSQWALNGSEGQAMGHYLTEAHFAVVALGLPLRPIFVDHPLVIAFVRRLSDQIVLRVLIVDRLRLHLTIICLFGFVHRLALG